MILIYNTEFPEKSEPAHPMFIMFIKLSELYNVIEFQFLASQCSAVRETEKVFRTRVFHFESHFFLLLLKSRQSEHIWLYGNVT
jgi:hypothetical protein